MSPRGFGPWQPERWKASLDIPQKSPAEIRQELNRPSISDAELEHEIASKHAAISSMPGEREIVSERRRVTGTGDAELSKLVTVLMQNGIATDADFDLLTQEPATIQKIIEMRSKNTLGTYRYGNPSPGKLYGDLSFIRNAIKRGINFSDAKFDINFIAGAEKNYVGLNELLEEISENAEDYNSKTFDPTKPYPEQKDFESFDEFEKKYATVKVTDYIKKLQAIIEDEKRADIRTTEK